MKKIILLFTAILMIWSCNHDLTTNLDRPETIINYKSSRDISGLEDLGPYKNWFSKLDWEQGYQGIKYMSMNNKRTSVLYFGYGPLDAEDKNRVYAIEGKTDLVGPSIPAQEKKAFFHENLEGKNITFKNWGKDECFTQVYCPKKININVNKSFYTKSIEKSYTDYKFSRSGILFYNKDNNNTNGILLEATYRGLQEDLSFNKIQESRNKDILLNSKAYYKNDNGHLQVDPAFFDGMPKGARVFITLTRGAEAFMSTKNGKWRAATNINSSFNIILSD